MGPVKVSQSDSLRPRRVIRPSRRAGGWIASVMVVVAGGCAEPWRPPLDTVRREDLPASFRVGAYFPDGPGGRWVYRRTRDGHDAGTYVRKFGDRIYVEGGLVGRAFQPLRGYLEDETQEAASSSARHASGGRRPRRQRAPLRGELGVILEFDPPLPPLPPEMKMNGAVKAKSELVCYDEHGRRLYRGTIARSVLLEGLEDVHTGEVDYPACLRLQIKTRVDLHWGPVIDLVQYVWLARGVGEVRRVERVTGWVLLLPFSATEAFELVAFEPPASGTTRPGPPHPALRPWAQLASEFVQTLPRPHIGGMRIELADREQTVSAGRKRAGATSDGPSGS